MPKVLENFVANFNLKRWHS